MPRPRETATRAKPPSRRHLALAPEPQSARRARKVVGELLETCGLGELADTATLLVSELVTNAVLHTATPIDLRCEVEAGTVCVQVGDRSPVLPGPRHYDDDALTGRGLGMVELLATAWGVEGNETGKTVWFQLSGDDVEPGTPPPVPSTADRAGEGDVFDVSFLAVPAALLVMTIQYGDSLLRELALTSIAASGGRPPLWQAANIDLGPLLDAVQAAQRHGDTVDVTVSFPVGAGTAAYERLSLVEEADAMARDGALLSAPTLPEISAFRRWFLSQVGLQERGDPPVAWRLPDVLPAERDPAPLPAEVRDELDHVATAVVVADDANRIIYVNEPAATLLGWDVDELVDQRLITIVPPELREAHLAGFGRYLITAEPQLLGRPVRVPALRRDGARVDIELTIEALDVGDGRGAFRAELR